MRAYNRIAACALPLIVMCAAPSAQAGFIDDFFDDVWVQTTDSKTFNTQRMGGLIGGSMVMRIPNRSINVVSFSTPSLDAGCGGLDINAGSFGFVDSQQLIELFKNIGQNAAALLFKIAVDAINASLGGLLTEFQQKVQAMNALFSNSCAIAQGAVIDPLLSAFDMQTQNTESKNRLSMFLSLNSMKTDDIYNTWDGIKGNWRQYWNEMKQNPDLGETLDLQDGNLTIRAALLSGGMAELQFGASRRNDPNLNKVPGAILLMNLFGTEIISPDAIAKCSAASTEAGGTGSGTQTDCAAQATKAYAGRTINDLQTLIRPTAQTTIIMCSDLSDQNSVDGTRALSKSEINSSLCSADKIVEDYQMNKIFPGTEAYISLLLWGDKNPSDDTKANPTKGLVAYLTTPGATLDQEHIRILESIEMPVLTFLRKVQRDPAAVREVAKRIEPMLAERQAFLLAQHATRAANRIFTRAGGDSVKKPAAWQQNVNDFSKMLNEFEANIHSPSKWMEIINTTNAYATNVHNASPGTPAGK